MTRKALTFDTNIVAQEKYWDCGPASAQILLSMRHQFVSEDQLIVEIGTTENGTDHVGLVARVLQQRTRVPWVSRYADGDPMSPAMVDLLWRDVLAAVDSGYGMVANIVSPPSNRPRGVLGSPSPNYGGSTVWHYVTVIGYDTDARAVQIGDPGFAPFVYWIAFDNLAALIPPKGWCLADTPGGAVPAESGLTAETLSEAMGGSLPLDRYAALLPAVTQALLDADCTTTDRVAMWMAQVGHESGGLRWMQEIADGSAYESRTDLGNTQPGDGRRFKGHGPIQITGRANHTAVSRWAFDRGLVPSPTYFVDAPDELAGDRFGFVGVTWYWTVARPMNSYADAGDIYGATRAVNGGLNGIEDRVARWNHCRVMGARILPTDGGFLMALTDDEQREILAAARRINGVVLSREPAPGIHESARPFGAAGVADANDVAALDTQIKKLQATVDANAAKGK